ncbi:MAG: hypothetical protein Q4G05_05165 [Clostridia bacterium]|nr:hypothetical protein [Clostridia bacterium]
MEKKDETGVYAVAESVPQNCILYIKDESIRDWIQNVFNLNNIEVR